MSNSVFSWNYGCEDVFKTVSSLIKYNNGVWKSTKQRDFVTAKVIPVADCCYPRDIANSLMYNVPMSAGQSGFILDGSMRWADYGTRSIRQVGWFFVVDEVGVFAKYKLSYSYKDGSSGIVQEKTKCEWIRPEGMVAPVEPPKEERPETFWVGEIGKRMTATLKEVAFIDRGVGTWGQEILTIWEDESGNKFYYNNMMTKSSKESCESGISVAFSIKKHITNKAGDKVTVIGRMSLTKEQKLIEIIKG